jgi:hypothetical protein
MMGFVKFVLISYGKLGLETFRGRGPNPHLTCQYQIVINYAITIQEISPFFFIIFLIFFF